MRVKINVIISFVIVIFFVYVIGNIISSDYVNVFGYTYFLVGSGSMSPTINSDDVVVVKLNDCYDVGDIVTYYDSHSYVTHRVLERYDDSVVLRGDYNRLEDKVVDKSNIIGKVVFVIGGLGKWRKVFTSVRVIIPLVITIILFVLVFSYKDGYKKFRMRRIRYVIPKKTKRKRTSSKKRVKKV